MDREQALETALGQIERQFGKGSVMKMSDSAAVSIGAVSTGSLALDLALGIGGLPRGRIVEIFGPESSGKTTLVYHVIAEAQRLGGVCAFIDAELLRVLRIERVLRIDERGHAAGLLRLGDHLQRERRLA